MSDLVNRLSAALADRYRIERELGQGGMATVYLAEDIKHERQVALKVLKPELAAVLGAERFIQEIKTTANLQHPHILPLFDSGEADSYLYYVMPFIDGETIRDRLDRETQLGVDEAVKITMAVADALDYAHRNGVIHRDIKPENILLHDGRPIVADFGIALAVSAAAGGRMTETGLSLGTPHYMSPEQATAEKEITNRSDIYSLGSVLYEMLTGDPPHTASSAQAIIMKIVTEEAPLVTKARKSVPPNVAAAVARSLEKLAADRFASAAEFGAALTNPSFATTLTPTVPGAPPSSRWKAALAAGLVLGATMGTAFTAMWSGPPLPAGERGREQLTFSGQSRFPAISPDGQFVAYVDIACAMGHPGRCRSALMLQEVGSTQPRTLLTDALSLGAPRWSHDGDALVLGGQFDDREGLFVVPRLSGTPRLIGPGGAYDTHPAADSVLLMPRSGGTGPALVLGLHDGAVLDSFPVTFDFARDVAWAPGGEYIAATTGGHIQVFDRTGRTTQTMRTTSNRATIRWTVDGAGLLYFRIGPVKEDELVRVDVNRDGGPVGAAEVLLGRVPTLYRGEFDIARGTGRLAIGTGDAISDIWSFDVAALPAGGRRETRGTTWYGNPALSLDGGTIYYYRGDALGDNVYMRDLATGVEEALTAQALPGGSVMRLSADGKRLAYAHSTDSTGRMDYIEFPSRQVFSQFGDVVSRTIEPVVPRSFLGIESGTGALALLDSIGAEWRSLGLPDSLAIENFVATPDGSTAVFVASVAGESARLVGTGVRTQSRLAPLIVGQVPLTGGDGETVASLDWGEPAPGLSVRRDGVVYLGRWLAADERPSLWSLSTGDGSLTRIADLPVTCAPETVVVNATGVTAACVVDDFRSDIWLVDVEGVMR